MISWPIVIPSCFVCLVVVHECVKCETKARKLGRGEEKKVKRKKKKAQKICMMTHHRQYLKPVFPPVSNKLDIGLKTPLP